ncbi:hypothetical protein [Streptomyces yaizuensis]|uniref:Uncharacterized protein n=1 Tax=Streptomyces yaizuensis TaxID=2989713 RepID=A0ABQ5NSN3_9ACTN|nr:hypothetical protein [Streptomyces sp. YSPA8]GLF93391.1 hypothetical protein SYYSPA8_03860 [Streptomyces sp. YSPA8]
MDGEVVVLTTVVQGRRVELPNTLGEIRSALPEARREEFDRVIASTPLEQVRLVAVMRFALPDEAQQEDAELAARIEAGDWSGVRNEDGTSYQP